MIARSRNRVKHLIANLTNLITDPYNAIDASDAKAKASTMTHIENRFSELLAQKNRRDRRNWTYEEISKVTGISPGTLVRFARQRHKMVDMTVLAKLCDFFECELGDLLVVVRGEEASPEVLPGRVTTPPAQASAA